MKARGEIVQGKEGTTRARNYFGPPGMGEKRRRAVAASWREHRPGGQSLRDRAREGWEEAGAKREESGVDR